MTTEKRTNSRIIFTFYQTLYDVNKAGNKSQRSRRARPIFAGVNIPERHVETIFTSFDKNSE